MFSNNLGIVINFSMDGIRIFKELAFVYIVKGKKFLNKRDAEIYIAELEIKEMGKEAGGNVFGA